MLADGRTGRERSGVNPAWRALFVSSRSARAHLGEPTPQPDGYHALRSWCGRVQAVNALALKSENADRAPCLLCSDAQWRRQKLKKVTPDETAQAA